MFSSIPSALSKVLVMMTGELNYDDIFHSGDDDEASMGILPFPISTQLFFVAFVIMVTIILFNLLIGFTVSDIQVGLISFFTRRSISYGQMMILPYNSESSRVFKRQHQYLNSAAN